MKKFLVIAAAASTTLAAPFAAMAGTTDWPQWRGPMSRAIAPETSSPPTTWSPTENVAWKTEIPGRGHSSPIVWGNRIFLTTAMEGDTVSDPEVPRHVLNGRDFTHPESLGADRAHSLHLLCLDASNGKIIWDSKLYEGKVFDNRHRKGSYASATPATDGNLVYCLFGSEGLFACDFEGKVVWKQKTTSLGTIGLGFSSSPVLARNSVIIECDEETAEKSYIAAYDRKTGKELWRTPRKVSVVWGSPLVVESGGRELVVASGRERLAAYDASNGTEVWYCQGLDANAVPTPVAEGTLVAFSTGYPVKKTVALDVTGKGDLSGTPAEKWKYPKGSGYVPSPLLMNGQLYLVNDSGHLTCLDAATGKPHYEAARLPESAQFTASPVAVQGLLLLTSERGDTFVVKSGTTYEFVGKNSVGESVLASPAVAGNALYIRGEKHLFCIRK